MGQQSEHKEPAVVRFSNVRDAFVSFGQPMENAAYLDLKTGATYGQSDHLDLSDAMPDDLDDSDRHIAIPHKNALGLGKPLALQFAAAHLPAQVDQVEEMFSHPGAYARFKDLLAAQDMRDAWHTYEQNWSEVALRRWCSAHGIALED